MPRTKRVPQGGKYKHWIVVINNPTDDDRQTIDDNLNKIAYLIVALEEGEKEKTPHIQAYVCFKNRVRKTAVAKVFPRAWLEVKSTESTILECIDYVKKDGVFEEYGVVPLTKGEATKEKWDEWYELAKLGDMDAIPKKMLIRYYPAFKRIAQDNPEKPEDLLELGNLWILAPTGYGKSRYVRDRFPDFYDKAPNKWFVGYKGQETLLLDDLGPEQCKYLAWYIKRWADLYSFPMETKGGGRQIRPKRVVVTSQYSIAECFEDYKVSEAVERRFEVMKLRHWKIRHLEEVQTIHGIVRTREECDHEQGHDYCYNCI